MEIRLLTPQDAKNYFDIRLDSLRNNSEAFASTYEEIQKNSVQTYEKQLQRKNSYTIGAFEKDRLVGIITLVVGDLYKFRHRANILSMYVQPEVRGKGVGKVLMEKAIEQAKKLGDIEQIYLTVVSNNYAAKRFYSSYGFETFGIEKRALKLENNTYLDEDKMVLFL